MTKYLVMQSQGTEYDTEPRWFTKSSCALPEYKCGIEISWASLSICRALSRTLNVTWSRVEHWLIYLLGIRQSMNAIWS